MNKKTIQMQNDMLFMHICLFDVTMSVENWKKKRTNPCTGIKYSSVYKTSNLKYKNVGSTTKLVAAHYFHSRSKRRRGINRASTTTVSTRAKHGSSSTNGTVVIGL